ncbi:MAG: ABC transporter permease [Patescibacteria group bacterium]|nr:ABC transporter permease [Patescibacteria group bacterium]
MLVKMFIANLKMTVRNRQSLFWSFMFPIMFTFIFGFFFGKNASIGNVALINQSKTPLAQTIEQALNDNNLFTIQKEDNLDDTKDKIKKNKLMAAIVIPENFGDLEHEAPKIITVLYDPGNSQANAAITGFLNQFLTATNYKVQNAQPIFSVSEQKITDKNLTYFDFILAGILGLSLMNSSIIGVGVGIAQYRQDKILKRIVTTPLPSWIFIIAEVLSRLVINFFQIVLILVIGTYVFDAHIYGSLWAIFGLALLGAILFQLLGFVIASISKTTDAAQGMATAITIPMMFLAGVFFPLDSLPKWLASIVQYLPLAPLLRMLRTVTLEGNSILENPINIIIVGAWIIAALIFAIFKFRLNEE